MTLIRRAIARLRAGGKDSMPEATPTAAGGTPDVAALATSVQKLTEIVTSQSTSLAEVTKAVGSLLEAAKSPDATKPAADAAKPAAGGKDAKPEAVTLDQISQLIDQKLGAASKANESKAARDAYLAEKLKDVPAAYRAQLGNDPAKWASEEQAIREQFKADLKAQGVEPKNLGNAAADGGTTPDRKPVDRSNMDPMQLLNSDK